MPSDLNLSSTQQDLFDDTPVDVLATDVPIPDDPPDVDPEVLVAQPETTEDEQFSLFGRNLFGEPIVPAVNGKLSQTFLVPPFSVLDARQGYWQTRKRAWLSLGIRSELGRGEGTWATKPAEMQEKYRRQAKGLAPGGSPRPACDYSKRERGTGSGQPLGDESTPGILDLATSVFDPVLCELSYRWFAPAGGVVLDPFAGGSVRGVVASILGLRYHGIDLSANQVEANREQAVALCGASATMPTWHVGDSATTEELPEAADFVFSCPPYHDLEVYSDRSDDLSNMSYEDFLVAYCGIIGRCVQRLKNDRFACFVVGDLRDKKGFCRNFPADTITSFLAAGCQLYNEAILVTPVGSLPIRTSLQFKASRKLGKTHQNVLIFVKGSPERAAEACGGRTAF